MSFFIAAFSSILWFLYGLKSINLQNITNTPETFYQITFALAFPIGIIWGIFAIVKSIQEQKDIRLQNLRITEQLNKNTETTNALNCALIALEKEIKSSFMLRELNSLIADCNEILSDIIKRSNSISSAQMEHLWTRTAGGERWLIAKTFIETYNFQIGFTEHLFEKAQKDPLLKGSILEFEARTKSLYQLLEMHDRERVFYNMIEYGAMGKVYNIIIPIAEKLKKSNGNSTIEKKATTPPTKEFSLTEETSDNFPSFLTRTENTKSNHTNAAQNKRPAERPNTTETQINKVQPTDIDAGMQAIRKELLSSKDQKKKPEIIKSFAHTQNALRNLKTEPSFDHNTNKKQSPEKAKKIISLDEIEKEIEASPENNYDEYAYPFGAWMDDKNNK